MHFVFYWTQLILAINLDYHGSTQHCKSRSGLINIFKDSLFTRCFQLCLYPARSSSPLPPSLVCCMSTTSKFALNPSRLLSVDVEMTSVVELFSDRFSFSVKSGMWTDPCCPPFACSACVLLINPLMNTVAFLAQNHLGLRTQTYSQMISTCLQLLKHWFISFRESDDHFASLYSLKSFSCMGTLRTDLYLMMYWGIGWGIGPKIKHLQLGSPLINSGWIDQPRRYESLIRAHYYEVNIELAHHCALLLHSSSRAGTPLTPRWVLLSTDNNCSLFAGQLIYHKRRCPKVLVPTTRTMWAKLQSASSSSIHPHYNKHAVTPIAPTQSGRTSQNQGWFTQIIKGCSAMQMLLFY